MDKKFIFVLTVIILPFLGCSKTKKELCSENLKHKIEEVSKKNVTRFYFNDDKSGLTKSGFFDENKKVVFSGVGEIYPFIGGFSYISNFNGNLAIDSDGNSYISFDLSEVNENFYGYGFYHVFNKIDSTFCVKDIFGDKISFPAPYSIEDGIAVVRIHKGNEEISALYDIENGSFLLDDKGERVIFDYAYFLNKKYLMVENNSLYGVADIKGNIIVPCKYKNIDIDGMENFIVYEKNKKDEIKLLDKISKNVIFQNNDLIFMLEEGVLVKRSGKMISFENTVTAEKYNLNQNYILFSKSGIYNRFKIYKNQIVFYNINNDKFGILNSKGEEILKPVCTEIKGSPDNGYWRVNINGKWYLFKETVGLLDPVQYLDFSKVKN